MLSTKRQIEYIRKIRKEAVEQLNAIADSSSVEELHRFRICIKKLKSFGKFLHPAKSKKYYAPLKILFSKAGNIRDISIANQIEDDHLILSRSVKNQRRAELDKAYREFAKIASGYRPFLIQTQRQISTLVIPVSIQSLKKYFKKKFSKIPGCLAQTGNDNIHRCRKKLKELLYLHNLLPESLQKKLKVDTEYLYALQEKIGKWHDLISAEPLLINRMNNEQIMSVIKKQKENLLKEIKKTGTNFIHKIRMS